MSTTATCPNCGATSPVVQNGVCGGCVHPAPKVDTQPITLEIKFGDKVFNTSFANLSDFLDSAIWAAATTTLHEVIKKHYRV